MKLSYNVSTSLDDTLHHQKHKEIEKAHNNPDQATNYFPPYVNVFNAPISHLAIQQGTHASSQTFNLTSSNIEEVKKVLDELNKVKETLKEEPKKRKELTALITTIQAQINSPRPNDSILHTALSEIKGFLSGVNVNLYTPVLIESIKKLIEQ